MPNMKAIKRRRLTVKNISQITKAMNLVATSKLQRARTALAAVSEPVRATFDIVYNTVSHPQALEHPLMQPRKNVKKVAYVLMSANRGLCGGYNSNVSKELIKHANTIDANPIIIPVGTKGRDYLRRRGYSIYEGMDTATDTVAYENATEIANLLIEMYTTGEVDEVYLVYTKFITVLNLMPIVRKVLPIDPAYLRRVVADNLTEDETWEDLGFFQRPDAKEQSMSEIEFEPSLKDVLASVVPWYLTMFIHAAQTSANLCEHAARMTSMDSSTKNAGEIIEKLTLQYNRQRQSIITQEITEIVSGANALQ